ncbi:MAG: hypothetical protein JOZ78_26635 [Chroococcidiopsidaceae cyanobacterium CP_BM_ER_R8_30]|nr:hypothetical protein [Chroococcidiopsidaceae cyanobacterium CP_BM_ER_R8_30]
MIVVKKALSLFGLWAFALSGGIFSLALTSLSADAAPPPAVFRDSAGNVYVHSGVNPNEHLKVGLIGQPYKKSIKAGACGQISIGTSTSMPSVGNTIVIDGTTIDLTKIAVASSVPKCTNGVYTPTPSGNFQTAKGRYELVGYTAGQSYSVTFSDVPNHFNATVNGCGFAAIKSTANHPLSTASQLTINGTAYTISTLTIADPPLCKKNGSTVTMYTPASW